MLEGFEYFKRQRICNVRQRDWVPRLKTTKFHGLKFFAENYFDNYKLKWRNECEIKFFSILRKKNAIFDLVPIIERAKERLDERIYNFCDFFFEKEKKRKLLVFILHPITLLALQYVALKWKYCLKYGISQCLLRLSLSLSILHLSLHLCNLYFNFFCFLHNSPFSSFKTLNLKIVK